MEVLHEDMVVHTSLLDLRLVNPAVLAELRPVTAVFTRLLVDAVAYTDSWW